MAARKFFTDFPFMFSFKSLIKPEYLPRRASGEDLNAATDSAIATT